MLRRLTQRIVHDIAVAVFSLLEVLGVPRVERHDEEDAAP